VEDEAQRMKNGEIIGHGRDVYYISPGDDYGRYLCEGVKRALDAGARPSTSKNRVLVRAGWSEASNASGRDSGRSRRRVRCSRRRGRGR